jgi:hypothetical protein
MGFSSWFARALQRRSFTDGGVVLFDPSVQQESAHGQAGGTPANAAGLQKPQASASSPESGVLAEFRTRHRKEKRSGKGKQVPRIVLLRVGEVLRDRAARRDGLLSL